MASEQARYLVATGFTLARERGLAALSARNLAMHTGLSASALNYHLGSREALLGEICELACKSAECDRADLRLLANTRLPNWSTFPHILTAALQSRLGRNRGVTALLLELENEAEYADDVGLRTRIAREVRIEFEYWHCMAGELGAGVQAATLWADFILGIIISLLWEEDAGVRGAWLTEPILRLEARIERRAINLTQIAGVPFTSQARERLANSPRAILDATIRTLARRGVDRTTMRAIAAAAEVPLAAVGKAFPNRQELILAAFEDLYNRHAEQADRDVGGHNAPSDAQLSLTDPVGSEGSRAINALLTATARDASFRPIAERLHKSRGAGLLTMLRQSGLEVDRIDAYVWGCITIGRNRRAALSVRPNSDANEQTIRSALSMLFEAPNRSSQTSSNALFRQ